MKRALVATGAALWACSSSAFIPSVPRSARVSGAAATARPFEEPPRIRTTENYRIAETLSKKLAADGAAQATPKTVAVIGGGLSGLACAKYLSDAGHKPIVYEARDVLGGKVSAWQDKDGDWVETGLHIFFGAYPNMMNLFSELDIRDRLQWKAHRMSFAMPQLPGEFTNFEFTPGIPAPFNMALAILGNQEMLSLSDKIRMLPGLLPMLVEGQSFIDAQDELSVSDFMKKYGMPQTISDEIFVAMAKALDFIDPDKLSMTVVLTAMNRFINEADGSQTAFIDGNQPERLCKPMVDHVTARGGKVLTGQPLSEIVVHEDTGEIQHLVMANGSRVVADEYVSAVPVDVFKRLIPTKWSTMPFFRQLDNLEGIPVINLHLWFDRKLRSVDGLCFSRSPLLSVYADMSVACDEYKDDDRSMLELVFAPCSPVAGSDINWIGKSDEEIVDATLGELARLFPLDIAKDDAWPSTASQGPQGLAKLRKYAVVRVPRSVYAAVPGRNKFRPSQRTPIPNFTLAGDFTSQKFLGSMEGAVLAGKLAAEVIADKAAGRPPQDLKQPVVSAHDDAHSLRPKSGAEEQEASGWTTREPVGVRGNYPIAFGGGQQGSGATPAHP